MHGLYVLFHKSIRELRNRSRTLTHSRLKVAVITFFAVGFWFGLYLLFREGFSFLCNFPDLLDWVMEYLLSLFFFSLTLMLVFSNGIIGYTGLFRARETWFLMSRPIPPGEIFLYKYSEAVIFSSWAFLFLGTPLMAAYGRVQGAGPAFYVLTLLLFLLFIFIPAAIGTGMALLIARFFPRSKKALFLSLGALGLLLLVLASSKILSLRGVTTPFSGLWMKGVLERFDFAQKPYLPSFWVARAVISLARQPAMDVEASMFYFGEILAWSLFLVWLAWRAAERWYLRAWSLCQSANPKPRRAGRSRFEDLLYRALFFLDPQLRHIVGKDLKTFLRDPVQWSQFLIFFGLLFIYFLNLRTLSYDEKAAGWKVMISVLNLSATALTLSTFTSRFVFPQLSLEGRRFWVIGMVPMRRSSILLGKFAFSFVGSTVISELLILISTAMLRMPVELSLLHALTMLAICFGLSGLSVGLGAMYPSFNEDNPSKIVAGFGGTLNLVLSLFFVVLIIALEAGPCHRYYALGAIGDAEFRQSLGVSLTGIFALSALAYALPMALGRRALERAEP